MSPIHWLRFIKKIKTDIDGHYILKNKEKFMVFTSKPVEKINCQKISDVNIKGEDKPQYLAVKVHSYNSEYHQLTEPLVGNEYYDNNKQRLAPYEKILISNSENE